MGIPSEQLLAEFEDLIRSMPPRNTLHHQSPEIQEWFGRALALVNVWAPMKLPFFEIHISNIHQSTGSGHEDGIRGMERTLHQARHDLRMKTSGPLTVAVGKGLVFDYFDEIRKVINEASGELFFVDPYLDAEFASRYLSQVKPQVAIRLLAREKVQTLIPAAELLRKQEGLSIEIRTTPGFHDRYLFVDRAECYQSGASFKDGASKAPTTLTQIVDAFSAIYSTYEQLWSSAKVV